VEAIRGANLGLKFFLELAAVAAFAYAAAALTDGFAAVLLAIAAAGLAILLWGVVAAPRSDHRLPVPERMAFELAFFGLAAVGLLLAGHLVLAVAFFFVFVVNAALLQLFGD
jgi:hypothetical protein